MPDPRVVVAAATLVGRRLVTTGVSGCRTAEDRGRFLAGAGAAAASAAVRTTGVTGVHVDLVSRVGDDSEGQWCLSELVMRGIDVSRVVRHGRTGEELLLEMSTGERETVLVPGGLDGVDLEDALASCRPGDVFLADAAVLASYPDAVEIAYEGDLQIVADLFPALPASMDPELVGRLDVTVVDATGAGAIADAAMPPASLAVHAGSVGSWWDDLQHEPDPALPAAGPDAPHRFAGALAAALASGMDRPEAFALAVEASTRVEA